MSRQTFNYCLKDAPGYWTPFVFLTEMREQRIMSSTNQTIPTYITIVFNDGETKFFRISRRLVMKIREICPAGNIADYLWQIRALRKNLTPFYSYEIRGNLISDFGDMSNFFRGINIEVLRSEANATLETIPNIEPRLESVMDANGREIEPETPVTPKFGRKIIDY